MGTQRAAAAGEQAQLAAWAGQAFTGALRHSKTCLLTSRGLAAARRCGSRARAADGCTQGAAGSTGWSVNCTHHAGRVGGNERAAEAANTLSPLGAALLHGHRGGVTCRCSCNNGLERAGGWGSALPLDPIRRPPQRHAGRPEACRQRYVGDPFYSTRLLQTAVSNAPIYDASMFKPCPAIGPPPPRDCSTSPVSGGTVHRR